jgi:hypothetical protein
MKTYKKRFNRKINRKNLKGGSTGNDQKSLQDFLTNCEKEYDFPEFELEPLSKTDYEQMIKIITEELKIANEQLKKQAEVNLTKERLKGTEGAAGTPTQKIKFKVVAKASTFIIKLKEEIKKHTEQMSKNWGCYKIILDKYISNLGISEFEVVQGKIKKLTQEDIQQKLHNTQILTEQYIATLSEIETILKTKLSNLNGGGKITKKKYHNKKKCRRYTKLSKKNMPKLNNKYKQRGGDGGLGAGIFLGICLFALFVYIKNNIDNPNPHMSF